MGCFTTILFLAGFVLVLVTFIRWFEQITEAVDRRWWNKVTVLLMCPFTVWLFPSRVQAGRATPVPRHEPVRGFGSMPKRVTGSAEVAQDRPAGGGPAAEVPVRDDGPPPGTPKEFLGMPVVPPPKPRGTSSAIDAEKIEKLRRKMRDQGMLDE